MAAPSFGESLVQHTIWASSPLARVTHQPSQWQGQRLLRPYERVQGGIDGPPLGLAVGAAAPELYPRERPVPRMGLARQVRPHVRLAHVSRREQVSASTGVGFGSGREAANNLWNGALPDRPVDFSLRHRVVAHVYARTQAVVYGRQPRRTGDRRRRRNGC
jgi:hypothetical protein